MQRHRTRTKILQRHSEIVKAAKEQRDIDRKEQMMFPPTTCLNVGVASQERKLRYLKRAGRSKDSILLNRTLPLNAT